MLAKVVVDASIHHLEKRIAGKLRPVVSRLRCGRAEIGQRIKVALGVQRGCVEKTCRNLIVREWLAGEWILESSPAQQATEVPGAPWSQRGISIDHACDVITRVFKIGKEEGLVLPDRA